MTTADYARFLEAKNVLYRRAVEAAKWAAPYQGSADGWTFPSHYRVAIVDVAFVHDGAWVDWEIEGAEDQVHVPLPVLLAGRDWKRVFLVGGIERETPWVLLAAEDTENLL